MNSKARASLHDARCKTVNRASVIIRLTEEEIRKDMMMNIDDGWHATSA